MLYNYEAPTRAHKGSVIDRKKDIIVLPHIVVALVVYNIYTTYTLPSRTKPRAESDKGM